MKKVVLLLSVVVLILSIGCAQQNPETITDSGKTAIADSFLREGEIMPEFPGGEPAMKDYIANNVKYPARAIEDNIVGRVLVEFVVTSTGSIRDVKVVNKVDPLLAKAAIKVIKGMPKWKPGIQDGKPVNVRFVVPINFNLEN